MKILFWCLNFLRGDGIIFTLFVLDDLFHYYYNTDGGEIGIWHRLSLERTRA